MALHLEWIAKPPFVEKFIYIVQKCRNEKNLANAKGVLMHIRNNGLETHTVLGNYIVPMLIECGGMSEAQEIFHKLVHRNEYSWTALIQGCIECGEFQHALNLFHKMHEDCVHPSRYTLQAILKACAALKCLERGQETHVKITMEGFEKDPFLCSSLVDMYAKCCSLEEAWQVLFKMPFRDVVLWNALISGYAEYGYGEEALGCLERMRLEGISASAVTLACTLKGCGSMGALASGQEIHTEVIKQGFEKDFCVDGTLLYMYLKCGLFTEAQDIFDELTVKNVICWTSLIAGYVEHGFAEKALSCLGQMQLEGVSPNAVTYACCLKGCGNLGAVGRTLELHMKIAKEGFERDLFIGNILVDVYGKFGLLLEAQEVFDELPARDLVSWNALISGHAENGLGEEALNCLSQMHVEGILANALTYVFSLKGCCSIGDVQKGQELHIHIAKEGLETDPCVGISLVDMYRKCGAFEEACGVFDKQTVHNVVSWTSLIAGYAEQGLCVEALDCLEQMQLERVSPNAITLVCCFKACGFSGDIVTGREIHAKVTKQGFEKDCFVVNSVVDMYAKCGSLAEARKVFEKLQVRDDISWTALIVAYEEHGLGEEALNCLEQMQLDGMCPNAVTYASILRVCDSVGSIDWGREIHADTIKKGFEEDLWIASALVVMYTKCCSVRESEKLFDKLPIRNVVLWTALVAGYVEHELSERALNCLGMMQLDSVSPNAVTLLCSLKASGITGAIGRGQEIHSEMVKKGFETESILGNALVDMYAKCGDLAEAQKQLETLQVQNIVSWTALITGYACQGESSVVFNLLDRIREKGVQPDGVTSLSALIVCSHAGLVDEGLMYFDAVNREDGITLSFEHHSCMVDCLARAGQLEKAVVMLEEMPFQPNLVAWTTMLGACRNWGDEVLGRQAFECAMGLDKKQAAAFLLMFNIYANANM